MRDYLRRDTASLSTPQFLLRCLRAFLAGEGEPPLRAPLEEKVDWNCLLRLARWHKVVPLLYRSLRGAGPPAVPEPVLPQLEAQVRSALGHSLLLTGELLRLLKHFEAQGIPVIPFKGPALAFFLYGDPALRQSVDIDILLHREDFPAAEKLLLTLGYQPSPEHQPQHRLTRRQKKNYRQYEFEESFTLARGDTRIVTELHWGIVSADLPFHPNLKGVWERCEPVSLAGTTIATLSPEDWVLFLCVHGSLHDWRCLQWICDVAQLVRTQAAMDWGRVRQQAKTAGCQRMLLLGLFLADDLLGVPLPPEIEPKIRHDLATVRLAGQVKQRLLGGSFIVPGTWERILLRAQLMEPVQDRISYWFRVLTTPTLADWSHLPLPDPLFPLYYVLRPLRLAGKYGRGAANHIYQRCKRM